MNSINKVFTANPDSTKVHFNTAYDKLIGFIVVIYILAYSWWLLSRFQALTLGGIDLTNYAQTLWKISLGKTPWVSLINSHALVDHFSLIWYPLSLLMHLWPSVQWLLILHVLFISSMALIVFRLIKAIDGDPEIAFVFSLIFLFSQYTQRVLLSPIHPESFSGLFIATALLFTVRVKLLWFVVFWILALSSNEDIGLYFIAVGFYWAIINKKPWFGIAVALFSLAWVAAIFPVKEMIGVDTQNHLARFSFFGSSIKEIVKNIVTKPWMLGLALLNADKLAAIAAMFLQVGFLPVFSGWGLLLVAAPILFKSLTNHVGMYRFWDHYSMTVLPFLWMAAGLGLQYLKEGKLFKGLVNLHFFTIRRFAWGLLGLNVLIQAALPYSLLSFRCDWNQMKVTEETRQGWAIIRQIPPGASVLTQERYCSSLALRDKIYAIHYPGQVPDGKPRWQPEVVLFNVNSFKHNWLEKDLQAANYFFKHSPEYSLWKADGGWRLYRRHIKRTMGR